MPVRLLVLIVALVTSPALFAQTLLGLNDTNALVRFSVANPGTVVATTPVTGLQAGEVLLGIDVRPVGGALYGLSNQNRLYTIAPATGAATLASTLSVALSGTVFATDFNPAADRLRVISDTGQSLRINVDTGATLVDGAINPGAPVISAAAYTNNVAAAPSTVLYDIDVVTSSLYIQNPPNNGTLTLVGALGVTLDAGGNHGFDIRTAGAVDSGFAVLRVAGITNLYGINLTTGAATLIGAVAGNPALRGVTVFAGSIAPPAPPTATAIGLTGGNSLLRFPVGSPGAVQPATAVSGLQAGEVLVGIDFRPATGALYGLTNASRLYTVDPASGTATFVSTLSVPLSGTTFGVDFNPVADRLRVISNTDQSLRINVDTGAVVVDGAINPPGANVAGAAYTNSFGGATATALFDIGAASSSLFLQNPPNNGTLAAVGPLGVTVTASTGFDILSAGGNNTPLAALNVGGSTGLYSIDITSGAATLIGAIGGNPVLIGLALSPNAIVGGPPGGGAAIAAPVNSPLALVLLMLALLTLGGFALRRFG